MYEYSAICGVFSIRGGGRIGGGEGSLRGEGGHEGALCFCPSRLHC